MDELKLIRAMVKELGYYRTELERMERLVINLPGNAPAKELSVRTQGLLRAIADRAQQLGMRREELDQEADKGSRAKESVVSDGSDGDTSAPQNVPSEGGTDVAASKPAGKKESAETASAAKGAAPGNAAKGGKK